MSEIRYREARTVVIPMQPLSAILPNAAVAEVIAYREPEAWDDTPPWFHGLLDWRHRLIPVIDLSINIGQKQENFGSRARILICNTLNGNDRLPFIGVVTNEIPHLVRVTLNNVEGVELDYESDLIKGFLQVNDENAYIPDMDCVEKNVMEILGTA